MRANWSRRLIVIAIAAAGIGAAVWALRPQPVPVDSALIDRGTLELVVSEESRTRVREVYTVSAPLGGTVQRSPREVGDEVRGRETVVSVIRPAQPEMLDARARREAEAAVSAAEATVDLARAQVREAEAQLAHAESEYTRAVQLHRRGTISESRFEEVRMSVSTAEARLFSAEATLAVRQRELETARARLVGPESDLLAEDDPEACCVLVRAPVNGQILEIHVESEQVVSAGTPLVDIGDPQRLEVVAELLSSDAVRIAAGAPARIDGWGGPELSATVRRVDPAGFTKVSALGIEEQRVRVVLDLDEPPEARSGLGHDFRVVTHITVERVEDAVLAPIGALFRRGAAWAVFVIDADDRAQERNIELGPRTTRLAVVEAGLEAGDRVILHPSDRVRDGTRVIERDD